MRFLLWQVNELHFGNLLQCAANRIVERLRDEFAVATVTAGREFFGQFPKLAAKRIVNPPIDLSNVVDAKQPRFLLSDSQFSQSGLGFALFYARSAVVGQFWAAIPQSLNVATHARLHE